MTGWHSLATILLRDQAGTTPELILAVLEPSGLCSYLIADCMAPTLCMQVWPGFCRCGLECVEVP
jgi:hypothetical protein